MEGKEPSCGYSVLAQILEQKPHKIIITTNFDSLTEDALFIYSRKKPIVIGHESLANFINPLGNRPIIVKIHRDVFLQPKSKVIETDVMDSGFKKNLAGVFKYHTPLIIGYGGNDGSLMGFLEELENVEGGLFWFYREKDGALPDRILKLIKKNNGYAVVIDGFDELMIQIGDKLKLERVDQKLIDISEKRAKTYREQIEEIKKKGTTDKETKDALKSIINRGEKDWWTYETRAQSENDPDKADKIYQEGLRIFPSSHELMNNYAIFLEHERRDYNRADEFYKKAVELNPYNPLYFSNYAIFLNLKRGNFDEAEKFHKKAIDINPNDAKSFNRYAVFLYAIRRDYDKAEEFYKRAIELNPSGIECIVNYAAFLAEIRKDYNKAEEFYKRAIEIHPNHLNSFANYADFLSNFRKDYDKAEEFYKKTIELDPNRANTLGNYAKCLIVKRNLTKAKKNIDKAFILNEKEDLETLELELWFYCYAIFSKDYPESENNIKRLLAKGIVSPNWYLGDVLKVAKELGHPDYEKLVDYAIKITVVK
jgi:Tfp pilus assembly protein PilF